MPLAKSQSRFVLDLKTRQGSLGKIWLDLPPAERSTESLYYLRRRERRFLPASYRTGLLFFGAVMVLSLLSITGISSKTMAESQQSWLSAELLQEFSQLRNTRGSSVSVDEQRRHFSVLNTQQQLRRPEPISGLLNRSDEPQSLEMIGLRISEGYQSFERFLETWRNRGGATVMEKLAWMRRDADQALLSWNTALMAAKHYPSSGLNPTEQVSLASSISALEKLSGFLSAFQQSYDPLTTLLGSDAPQRLLIFLQDPSEKRATGGVLSAGVEILLDRGKIVTWKPFMKHDDANTFLDVTKSMEKIHGLWQREEHSSVDAIVFVNTTAVEELLTGLEDAKAFEGFEDRWSELRVSGKDEDLKALASGAIELLISHLETPNFFLNSWPSLQALTASKAIMVVASDPDLQESLTALNVSGALPSLAPHEDALMIASINTEDTPSDHGIQENDRLDTTIAADGSIRHWLKVERRGGDNGANTSMMRVLVPLGSLLTGTDGLEITEVSTTQTADFTVWSFPMKLNPGESRAVALIYELPWRFDTGSIDNYRLQLIHQPGSPAIGFEHHLKLPANLTIFQQLPEEDLRTWDRDETVAIVAGRAQ